MGELNYINIVRPHKKCVATFSVTTTSSSNKIDVSWYCQYCYKKMRKPRGKWITVSDFGKGIDAEKLVKYIVKPPIKEDK